MMRARLVVFPIKGRIWCFSRSMDSLITGGPSQVSSTPATVRDLLKSLSSSSQPVIANAEFLVDFVSNKMNTAWTSLEKAPQGSFKSKIHGVGLRLLPRVNPSEHFLKSISKEVTGVDITYPMRVGFLVPANSTSTHQSGYGVLHPTLFNFQARSYARDNRKQYDLFGQGPPGSKEFRKAWTSQLDEEDCVWTASEDESDSEKKLSPLEKEIRKVKQKAKEHSDRIDADDSDELWSVWSGSDEEKTLWTGSEEDDDDDIPTEPYPNAKSDMYIDKLFEFEETPKYRTLSELLKAEDEPEELSPGKKARKLAVQNALKKLKKGPDGRYTNVWEVMSDIDILIGAFENIVSGPEYAELRQGGPKQLNMQFFKDIQAKMRDPNYKFSPELKLKPKSKLVRRKKWQKAQSRRRKDQKR